VTLPGEVRERDEIYLDNNATTRPLPEVVEVVAEVMRDAVGNPSSVHGAGKRTRDLLRAARTKVAHAVRATAADVVFTSGATEGNNLALRGAFESGRELKRLVTTVVEHSSILEVAEHLSRRGISVVLLPVDRGGKVDLDDLRRAIKPGETLVSLQWANNETGVLQDVVEAAFIASRMGALFHTDAVQAVGKIPIDLRSTPVDLLTLSGHKVHGPLGVGAVVGPGVQRLEPITFGGAQEAKVRPGTENLPAIVGLAEALAIRASRFGEVAAQTRSLRDRFERNLIDAGLVAGVNGGPGERLPNTSNLRFEKVDGEALTIRLDQAGVRCSQSSACTNQKPEPSYVLRAMGLSEDEAYASVRFGLSEFTSLSEIDSALGRISAVHASLARFAFA